MTKIPMQPNAPVVIHSESLARAWARVFLSVFHSAHPAMRPAFITLDVKAGCEPEEDAFLRSVLAEHLRKCGKVSIEDNAAMIFPYRPWLHLQKPGRDTLYSFHRRMEARAGKRTSRNQYGTYFARMTAYTGVKNGKPTTVNQIEHVLARWNHRKANGSRPRVSEMQLACFDPAKDHTGQALRGFPCLQQVSLAYDRNELSLAAYYPTQYIFDRGYGNYLGLCRLGLFLAHEMGLSLTRVSFFIGSPRLGDNVRKGALEGLGKAAESISSGTAT
jgi:hypothetical protein